MHGDGDDVCAVASVGAMAMVISNINMHKYTHIRAHCALSNRADPPRSLSILSALRLQKAEKICFEKPFKNIEAASAKRTRLSFAESRYVSRKQQTKEMPVRIRRQQQPPSPVLTQFLEDVPYFAMRCMQ